MAHVRPLSKAHNSPPPATGTQCEFDNIKFFGPGYGPGSNSTYGYGALITFKATGGDGTFDWTASQVYSDIGTVVNAVTGTHYYDGTPTL
jgi:hypothetical protein